LSRRTEIATTYTEVASSRTIKKSSLDRLELSKEQRQNLAVKSQLVAGTNVLKITVEAPDPTLAKEVANAVGVEMIAYTKELYEPFVLKPLDEAMLRNTPVRPTKQTNILLGGAFGLVLGAGLAFLAEYLRSPLKPMASMNIIDNEIGVYNKHYFLQRLGTEIARAERQNYPLSVTLMNIGYVGANQSERSSKIQNEILRETAAALRQHLREEDLLAYFGDTTFALLLPDISSTAAKETIDELQARLVGTPFELERNGVKINLTCVAAVTALEHGNGMKQNELILKASQALQSARINGRDQAHLVLEEVISQYEQAE
jgi:diguanylate cyclase (GGDEF)-like protein